MIEPERLKALLLASFAGGEVELTDLTGTADHYEAIVVSEAFADKSLVERHRMVYGALGAAMGREVHAFTFKTFTPEAWAKARAK